ncbi:MAG: DUF1508 domain-containing protein [Clostridia bacterium]|nr:DUF1508 domain-containing protein [Clostridia bacterium]
MQWLKDLIKNAADAVGVDGWVVMVAGLAAIVLVLAIIIGVIAAIVRGKKKKKAVKAAAKATQAAQPVKTETPKVKEQPKEPSVLEIGDIEPIKEEQAPKPTVKKPTAKKVSAPAKPAAKPATKSATKPVAKAAKKPVPAAKTEKPKALGKWVVEQKSDDEFISLLSASNGEIMLTSETYVSEDGARKGIETIIKAVESGEFVIHKTKNGTFYFKLKSAGNRLLCAGEIYKERTSCENAVESVKRIAADSPIAEEVSEGEKYLEYKPVKLTEKDIERATSGKWRIETTEDDKYFATLYASNGQVMLSTEEVSSKATAVSGIENVKKNALAGNFVIDKDKFGKYYYKLRNAHKSIICIGESYKTADSCISALESVRKLAAKSQIAEEIGE